jgi:hypothetical protein
MGLIDRLFGSQAGKGAPASRGGPQSVQGGQSTRGPASAQTVRKELVRVCVRDMLLHNGIPADWIRVEPLTTSAPGREPGVHARLVVVHWNPRIMLHAVALQEYLEKRIGTMDPAAELWMMGISWQFALPDVSGCPPLPHPGSWTAPLAADAFEPPSAADTRPGGSADVISGPTRIAVQHGTTDARQQLERMLSERDADFRKGSDADDAGGFDKTQPMGLDKHVPAPGEKSQPAFEKTQPIRRG